MRKLILAVIAALLAAGALLIAAVPAAGTGHATASPARLSACYGHKGVEFSHFRAWLCEVKMGDDPSGSLYFSPTDDTGLNNANPGGQMIWDKLHAGPGNFYVWGNYSEPWGGSAPRSNGRIVAIDEGPAGQCIVAFPSWTQMPTECFLVKDGGAAVEPPHPLTAVERSSLAEYIKNKRADIPLEYR